VQTKPGAKSPGEWAAKAWGAGPGGAREETLGRRTKRRGVGGAQQWESEAKTGRLPQRGRPATPASTGQEPKKTGAPANKGRSGEKGPGQQTESARGPAAPGGGRERVGREKAKGGPETLRGREQGGG